MSKVGKNLREIKTANGMLTLRVVSQPSQALLCTAQKIEGQSYDLVDGSVVWVDSVEHAFMIEYRSEDGLEVAHQTLWCDVTSQERLDAHWANWVSEYPESGPVEAEPVIEAEADDEDDSEADATFKLSSLNRADLTRVISAEKRNRTTCSSFFSRDFRIYAVTEEDQDEVFDRSREYGTGFPSLKMIRKMFSDYPEANAVHVSYDEMGTDCDYGNIAEQRANAEPTGDACLINIRRS
jgi:hypothetical protein